MILNLSPLNLVIAALLSIYVKKQQLHVIKRKFTVEVDFIHPFKGRKLTYKKNRSDTLKCKLLQNKEGFTPENWSLSSFTS